MLLRDTMLEVLALSCLFPHKHKSHKCSETTNVQASVQAKECCSPVSFKKLTNWLKVKRFAARERKQLSLHVKKSSMKLRNVCDLISSTQKSQYAVARHQNCLLAVSLFRKTTVCLLRAAHLVLGKGNERSVLPQPAPNADKCRDRLPVQRRICTGWNPTIPYFLFRDTVDRYAYIYIITFFAIVVHIFCFILFMHQKGCQASNNGPQFRSLSTYCANSSSSYLIFGYQSKQL